MEQNSKCRKSHRLLPHNFSTLRFCEKHREHNQRITVDTGKTLRTMTTTFNRAGLPSPFRWGKDASFQVVLPNGRNVELCSKKGADEFVDSAGTDFISAKLTATDGQELRFAYMLIISWSRAQICLHAHNQGH
jgi:hypothetical protein